VTETVIGFQKKSISDHETLSLEALDLPPQHFMTQAVWYTMPDLVASDELPLNVIQGSLHAAEHSQIAVLPLIAMCDRWDIGGLSTAFHPQTGQPTIFIYDGHPGGVGITRRGYEQFERLTADALRLISECPCESGCPSCVQSPKCGNLNEPLHKAGAVKLLRSLCD
jgi:DEAD/DEAH box helicase domain-containing protein